MNNRGFELVTGFDVSLPERKTTKSAGYDIASAVDVDLYPGRMKLVPTGIKAYMMDDEYLDLRIRSGLSTKNQAILINGAAVIDADYYNNPDNEGHIFVPIYNLGKQVLSIKKGERIAQGIFTKYYKVGEDAVVVERDGGFGSTDKPKRRGKNAQAN